MHISLDQALDRQPNLNKVGSKVLQIAPDAAAAYSLRSLNSNAQDVVRVRRSADNEERDFNAVEVNQELEDWVNGKREVTLPCDNLVGSSFVLRGATGDAAVANGHRFVQVGNDQWRSETNSSYRFSHYDAGFGSGNQWRFIEHEVTTFAVADAGPSSVHPTLANWRTMTSSDAGSVNPQLGTNLLGDATFDNGAAAAYSLRKVKSDYTGNAVQIRRTSDNAEAGVAFDGSDEVSTSSAITVTSGDTTATTLGEFLTEESSMTKDAEDGSTSGFNTSDFVSSSTISTTSNNPISGTKSYLLSHTGTSGAVGYPRLDVPRNSGFVFALNKEYRVQFKAKLISGTTRISGIRFGQSGNGAMASPYSLNLTLGEAIEYDGFVNATSIGGSSILNIQFDGTDGDFEVLIDDIKITANEYDCTVSQWYDQSGNGNDATQDVAGSQPLIAENGNLITDSNNQPIIDFLDDSVTGFNISNSISPDSIFAVVDITDMSGTQRIFGRGGNNGIIIESNQASFRFNNSTSRLVSSATGKQLLTGIDGPSGLTAKNGTEVTTSGITTSFFSGSDYKIGVLYFTGTTQAYKGHMYELIIYDSDQSANRFKIESNINNHYQIDGYKVHYEYDFTSGDGGFEVASGVTIATNQTVDGRDECLKATSQAGSGFNLIKDSQYPSDLGSYVIEGEAYIDPSNVSLKGIKFALDSSSGGGYIVTEVTQTGWSTFRFSFNTASVADDFQIIGTDANGNASFTRTAGDFFALRNVKSKFAQNGFVNTWYDQSGNGNDATQISSDNQPKIVNAGSLLADGITFDGTDDKLDINGYAPLSLVYSSFVVASIEPPYSSGLKTIFDSSNSFNGGFAIAYGNTSNKFTPFWFDGDDDTANVFGAGSDLTNAESLYSTIIKNGDSTVHIAGTLDQTLTNTWTSAGSNSFTKSTIGYDQGVSNRRFTGKIQELIIYESDQSLNRTAIETNIANEYGITLS